MNYSVFVVVFLRTPMILTLCFVVLFVYLFFSESIAYAQTANTYDDAEAVQSSIAPSNVGTLSEQIDIIPSGAPKTGAGSEALHKMDGKAALPLLVLVLSLLVGLGIKSAIYDWMKIEKTLV